MYAICLPSGDQVCAEIVAPFGVSRFFVAPVRGFTSVRPTVVSTVTLRLRFAFVSIGTPPSQRCGLPYAARSPRGGPTPRRNHERSEFGWVKEMSTRGAMIIRSMLAGGFTNVSDFRISSGFHAPLFDWARRGEAVTAARR